MPELPEVETIVSDLNKEIKGNIISDVLVFNQKTFKNYSSKTRELIKDSKIEKFERRGKYIIFHLKKANKNSFLITHLKMTGNFSILRNADLNEIENIKHARAAFIFKSADLPHDNFRDNSSQFRARRSQKNSAYQKDLVNFFDKTGAEIQKKEPKGYHATGLLNALIFKDIRKFGKIYFEDKNSANELEITKNLGPDALLNLNLKEFENSISKKKTKIKPLLLNQEFISGIGNIYADESLWASKIHPLTPANKLSKQKIKALFNAIKKILKTAVKLRGSSMRDYKDLMGRDGDYIKIRKVYMREGLPCLRCKTLDLSRNNFRDNSSQFRARQSQKNSAYLKGLVNFFDKGTAEIQKKEPNNYYETGLLIIKTKIGQRSAHFCPNCQKY